jgi:hypothetical protein
VWFAEEPLDGIGVPRKECVAHLRAPSLEYVLAENIQMEDRIELLKALKITESDGRRMMRLLSKIRNKLVHNVQQIDFEFSAYLKNKENRHNFVEAFATGWPDQYRAPHLFPALTLSWRIPGMRSGPR